VFILCCSTFFWWWMCAYVVLGFVFPYQAKLLACRTSPKWPILCRVGCKTTTQSINQSIKQTIVYISCISCVFIAISLTNFCIVLKVVAWHSETVKHVCVQMKTGYMRLQSLCRSRTLTHQFALFRTKMMIFQVKNVYSIFAALTFCFSASFVSFVFSIML